MTFVNIPCKLYVYVGTISQTTKKQTLYEITDAWFQSMWNHLILIKVLIELPEQCFNGFQ